MHLYKILKWRDKKQKNSKGIFLLKIATFVSPLLGSEQNLQGWSNFRDHFQITLLVSHSEYPIQPKRLVRPGQLAGNSERARGIFSLFYNLILFYFFNMKPLSVDMACLLVIQNEIQAVWLMEEILSWPIAWQFRYPARNLGTIFQPRFFSTKL